MTTISATTDNAGNSGLKNVNVDEILYLEVESKTSTIMLVTLFKTYYTTGTLNYWTHVLNKSGHCFHAADRSCSVNISKIVAIEPKFKIAYFDYHDQSKRCMMSKGGMREVLEMLEQTHTSYQLQ